MRNGIRNFGLAGALGLALALAGCNAEGPTTAETGGLEARPSLTANDTNTVAGGPGQEATTAGDTTARGGVYVGSGH
jgi:hypothetical protein